MLCTIANVLLATVICNSYALKMKYNKIYCYHSVPAKNLSCNGFERKERKGVTKFYRKISRELFVFIVYEVIGG